MTSHGGTTLKQDIQKQKQDLPGLQRELKPKQFDTALETEEGHTEYTGSGKLKGKKALITGGEYVSTDVIRVSC